MWLTFHYKKKKVTVWCSITSNFILDRYFFEEVTALILLQTCTIMSTHYLEMLANYDIPELQKQNVLMSCGCKMVLCHMWGLLLNVFEQKCLMIELYPIISHFSDHQGSLISLQWISGCGDTLSSKSMHLNHKLYMIWKMSSDMRFNRFPSAWYMFQCYPPSATCKVSLSLKKFMWKICETQ